MNHELISQLTHWHEQGAYQNIEDRILSIPDKERDYTLTGHYGRALNNLGRYEEAIEQLMHFKEEGGQDPVWQYRIGYAYYHLKQYDQAIQAFGQAARLDPGNEDALSMLEWSRSAIEIAKRIEQASAWHKDAEGNPIPFEQLDWAAFWRDSDYALQSYVSEPPTEELIASVEEELGYKLPAAYIFMMKQHNGGIPHNSCFPTQEPTSWSDDHVAIEGILGIGRDKSYSLCGDLGSPFMIEDWGYPDIGVVLCDCPSAGHDVIMLDYRACGRDGEPAVIHVDQEADYQITHLADSFEAFIRGLVPDDVFDIGE